MPQISVVLPIYNVKNYLQQTVESILSQTFMDFEIICIDDGSTDGTTELLQSLATKDVRIKVYRQKNAGPGASRNAGLDKASGDYVIMLDADDIYREDMLQKLYERAVTTEADVTVCRSIRFDDSTNEELDSWWTVRMSQIPPADSFCWRDMPDFIFSAFMGWPWDKLYKRSFVEEHSLRFPPLSNSEDLYFVFLSLVKAQAISVVDEQLVRHRDNRNGSVSGTRAKNPFDFYTSTCLLKAELKKDHELYEKTSWGFLNWAFEYMVWNIETMNDPKARDAQLNALRDGGFPELEIETRSATFYSLHPDTYGRYIKLLEEITGEQILPIDENKGHVILPRIVRFLDRIDHEGLMKTISSYLRNMLARSEQTSEPSEPPRSKDFIMTASKCTSHMNGEHQ